MGPSLDMYGTHMKADGGLNSSREMNKESQRGDVVNEILYSNSSRDQTLLKRPLKQRRVLSTCVIVAAARAMTNQIYICAMILEQ